MDVCVSFRTGGQIAPRAGSLCAGKNSARRSVKRWCLQIQAGRRLLTQVFIVSICTAYMYTCRYIYMYIFLGKLLSWHCSSYGLA